MDFVASGRAAEAGNFGVRMIVVDTCKGRKEGEHMTATETVAVDITVVVVDTSAESGTALVAEKKGKASTVSAKFCAVRFPPIMRDISPKLRQRSFSMFFAKNVAVTNVPGQVANFEKRGCRSAVT